MLTGFLIEKFITYIDYSKYFYENNFFFSSYNYDYLGSEPIFLVHFQNFIALPMPYISHFFSSFLSPITCIYWFLVASS